MSETGEAKARWTPERAGRSQRFEVAVIGGGLVGAAVAFGLRSLGSELVILDEGDVAHRAARANFGLIWVQGKGGGVPQYAAWTQRSAAEWPRLANELLCETGIDVALAQPGGVHICLSGQELERRAARLAALQAQPGFQRLAVDVLDRAQLASRLPGLGPDVAGGTFCASDGHCNPLKLLRALHAAAIGAGAVYRADHAVARIAPRGPGFVLETRGGMFAAGKVVLAAGLGNAALAPMVELDAPVRPSQGQIIALERVPHFLALPLSTIRQTDEGTVLIGDSQQERGFDDACATDVVAAMSARALRVFPALGGARVVRAWAGLRVMTPDGAPVYEQSATHPGAFAASCHSGVTLAAAHAYALAPAVVGGAMPESLLPFAATRFVGGAHGTPRHANGRGPQG